MRGSTGFHHFPLSSDELARAQEEINRRTSDRRARTSTAFQVKDEISLLPAGKQKLIRQLVAHVASSHTSRNTRAKALEQLRLELSRPGLDEETTQILATLPHSFSPATGVVIEASMIAGEDVAP